jgi:hypothetical protein
MNFTDPKDQSTVMVGKVQPKEADRPASGKRHQRAAAPATTEQLSKLMAHFQK